MFWTVVLIILGILFAALLLLGIIALIKKPGSIYKNQPEQKNPMEGKKVIFVEDENDKENADGVRGHLEAVGVSEKRSGFYENITKRVLDVILSFGGLVVLSPVYLVLIIAIVVDDPGPVLFTQKRVGKDKQYFKLHKFRSMKMSTPHDVPTHMLENPDQYITKVGKFIRAHSLDATACASLETWNKLGRWVNRGAKGIVLLDDRNPRYRLRYVFDVSDTNSRYGYEIHLWQMQQNYEQSVIGTMENHFGELTRTEYTEVALLELSDHVVKDNLTDYFDHIEALSPGIFDDENVKNEVTNLVVNSVTYMVWKRCGYDTSKIFTEDIFENGIRYLNKQTLSVIGEASSDISRTILLEIGEAVKEAAREEAQNRTFEKEKKIDDNIGEKYNSERRIEHGTELQAGGRDSNPGYGSTGESENREVRNDEIPLPPREQTPDVHNDDDRGQAERASGTDRPGSDRDDGTPHEADVGEGGRDRDTESDGSDEVGTDDELDSELGGGDGTERTDPELKTELPGCMPDVLIQALRHGDYLAESKENIVSFLSSETNEDRKNEYVRGLYKEGLFAEMFKPNSTEHIGYHATRDGLTIYDGNYLTRTAESFFSWNTTRELIEALIEDRNYLDVPKTASQISIFENAPAEKETQSVKQETGVASTEVLDNLLRLGSATPNSTARIYGYYLRPGTEAENIVFLLEEYESDCIGFEVNGKKYAAVWNESGVDIAEGNSVAESVSKVHYEWETIEARIRELIESGQYISSSEAEKAADVWDDHVADKITSLHWDYFENIPDEYLMLTGHAGGFPSQKDFYRGMLRHPHRKVELLEEIRTNIGRISEYPPRFKYNFSPEYVEMLTRSYLKEPKTYPAGNVLPPAYYVSQDKVDEYFIGDKNYLNETKLGIYSFFLNEKDAGKRAKFMSERYGIGGSGGHRYNTEHDGKGLRIGGGLDGFRQGEMLKWSQVAKRIEQLIKADRFLNDKEKAYLDTYEKKQVARCIQHFFIGKPDDVPKPYQGTFVDDHTKEIIPQMEDADRFAEIRNIMTSAFEAESPDGCTTIPILHRAASMLSADLISKTLSTLMKICWKTVRRTIRKLLMPSWIP